MVAFYGAVRRQVESFLRMKLMSTSPAHILRNSGVQYPTEREGMPNDAKLGLLAGVIGVIAVAVVSANGPTPQESPNPPPAVAHAVGAHMQAKVDEEHRSRQFPRTRLEPDGMPASFKPTGDIEP